MDDLDAMYQEIILDAAKARNGEGRLERFQGESFQVNTTCGDEVNLQVELSSDGKRIERIGWTGDGCSISRASIGIMIDMLEGRSVREAADLYDVFRALMDSRGHALDEEIEQARDRRRRLAATIDATLLAEYEAARAVTGGIGALALYGRRVEGGTVEISPAEHARIAAAPADAVIHAEENDVILVRMEQ